MTYIKQGNKFFWVRVWGVTELEEQEEEGPQPQPLAAAARPPAAAACPPAAKAACPPPAALPDAAAVGPPRQPQIPQHLAQVAQPSTSIGEGARLAAGVFSGPVGGRGPHGPRAGRGAAARARAADVRPGGRIAGA